MAASKPIYTTPPEICAIAVMGVTGSGKSNFICHAGGLRNGKAPAVGHNLESCTQETIIYETFIGGKQFVFFDTPGFDDTYRGDADILANIAQSLSVTYRQNIKLSGIVYFHRIKDEKMTNAIMRNLTMFRSVCGDDAFKNVLLATTFWDELPDEEKGASRETQLLEKPEWWGYMKSKGSQSRRFRNTRASALEILAAVTNLPAVTLQIQEEMVNQGCEVGQTTAGETLDQDLASLKTQFEEELEVIRKEKEQARKEHDIQLQVIKEAAMIEKQDLIEQLEAEQAALHADRREQERRMEQAFNDQILRLKRESRARQQTIDDLESRLSQERADFEKRFQSAMEDSSRAQQELTSRMAQMVAQDHESKAKYDEALEEMKRQQTQAQAARDEAYKLAAELEEAAAEHKKASGQDRAALEERIEELEAKRSSSKSKIFAAFGTIVSIVAAVCGISGVNF